jgi:hypothetical protein
MHDHLWDLAALKVTDRFMINDSTEKYFNVQILPFEFLYITNL